MKTLLTGLALVATGLSAARAHQRLTELEGSVEVNADGIAASRRDIRANADGIAANRSELRDARMELRAERRAWRRR